MKPGSQEAGFIEQVSGRTGGQKGGARLPCAPCVAVQDRNSPAVS